MLEFLAAAGAEHAEHAAEHAEAMAFGIPFLTPGAIVALAMICVILIMLKAGVPRIIAGMLDKRIAEIRTQLDEASQLRREAEELKARYEAKTQGADAEIGAIRSAAERQAAEIVAKAETDATALIARRQQLAQDTIAAAERRAVDDLRTRAATAASAAAHKLIAERQDSAEMRGLVDQAIASI